jgi:hypothetical protein
LGNIEWSEIVVISLAFVVGYSIVSFIMNRFKSGRHEDGMGSSGQTPGSQVEHGHERTSWNAAPDNEEAKHANALGLKPGYSPNDIPHACRETLAKYQPDRFEHLDDEFKQIAQTKSREAIEAYAYFKKKYSLRM